MDSVTKRWNKLSIKEAFEDVQRINQQKFNVLKLSSFPWEL